MQKLNPLQMIKNAFQKNSDSQKKSAQKPTPGQKPQANSNSRPHQQKPQHANSKPNHHHKPHAPKTLSRPIPVGEKAPAPVVAKAAVETETQNEADFSESSVVIAPDASIETTKATFAELPLIEQLQRALKDAGYEHPTPIQLAAIPELIGGRDLLGCAQTGTGKTAAFALPILQNLSKEPPRLLPKTARALILTPTRELAIQINESFKTYGRHLRLKTTVIFGGVGQQPQVNAMKGGVDILVATPGRLLDLIQQKHVNLGKLEIFVLDEADRMLDMGFVHDVKRVIAMLPKERQSLFFSATMPNDIKKLADSMLVNPAFVEVTPVSSTAELIDQYVMYVERSKKKDLLRFVLQEPKLKKVIVFTRTKRGANQVSEVLDRNGIASAAIHGNKSQNARQRALEEFRAGKIRVLVATDIAARGIDIDEISHVINFEVPNVAESYVHRIGRTARAGASGIALSFCDTEERSFIRDIEKLIGQPIPVATDHPYHSEQIANARIMSSGKAKAALEKEQNGGRRGGGRRGGGKSRSRRH